MKNRIVNRDPANLAALPGISIPCGLGDDGLPVGLQILAPRWEEERLLRLALRLESALAFADRHAPPS